MPRVWVTSLYRSGSREWAHCSMSGQTCTFKMHLLPCYYTYSHPNLHFSSSSVIRRCDSNEKLRNSLDYLRSVLNDATSFKLIYRYAFDFARVRVTVYALGQMIDEH